MRAALGFAVASAVLFAAAAPFAKVQLAPLPAFIPIYETALVTCDLLTAALLFGQFRFFRSPALLALGSGYLFTALIAVAHMATFPGLFAPSGLLGAGPQSTAWLYMFWHAAFPLFVVAYALLKRAPEVAPSPYRLPVVWSATAAVGAAAFTTFLATAGHAWLPAIMVGNRYSPTMIVVVTATWMASLAAFIVLWRRRPHATLDYWLMVVMWAWMFDVALSAVLNAGRFDLGFYAGRVYGLVAASVVLVVLVVENARLYARLRERTRELEEAKHAAQAAERAKGAFLAAMSHEIRTPMNGVMGMLELMSLGALDAGQRKTLDIVRDSSASLMRIIDDILDFSKIEAGKLDLRPEPASIAELAERVRNIHSGNASAKGLPITLSVDQRIAARHRVDALRLQQILGNLVSNAVKFTSAGSVALRVEVAEEREGVQVLLFTVEDTGVGVKPEDQARLFAPFVQAGERNAGGTGLGLSICRSLVSLMGGTLEMESEPRAGTRMRLRIPLPVDAEQPSTTPAAEPAVPQAPAGEGQRVLVVDDHPVNRVVLARQLEALGYATVLAENGLEALARLEEGGVGAVITDCHMPEMDGYELARQIRAREERTRSPRLPVLACTANAMAGEADHCRAAGMDDYLAKPLTLERLRAAMRQWMPQEVLAPVFAGNPELEQEVLEQFWRYSTQDAGALKVAVSGERFRDLVHAAHRLKGSSAAVGAQGLAAACECIEQAGRRGDWPAVAAAMGAFDREWEALSAALAARRKAGAPTR